MRYERWEDHHEIVPNEYGEVCFGEVPVDFIPLNREEDVYLMFEALEEIAEEESADRRCRVYPVIPIEVFEDADSGD